MIEAHQLSKAYSNPGVSMGKGLFRFVEGTSITALKAVSFEVHKGEALGIIGSNGAGKSTLLKVLSRITSPSGGQAILRGRLSPLIGVGFGNHTELTGKQNIYFAAAVLGMDNREIDECLNGMLEFAQIGDYLNVPMKRFSDGMSLRLSFAIALHFMRDILFVDEALAAGDESFQHRCLARIQSFTRQGGTALLTSHDPKILGLLCERCLWLEKGQLVRIGNTSEVLSQYLAEAKTLGTRKDVFLDKAMNHEGPWT
jgi:lipopolysaccharide transport system ATP-binding protein